MPVRHASLFVAANQTPSKPAIFHLPSVHQSTHAPSTTIGAMDVVDDNAGSTQFDIRIKLHPNLSSYIHTLINFRDLSVQIIRGRASSFVILLPQTHTFFRLLRSLQDTFLGMFALSYTPLNSYCAKIISSTVLGALLSVEGVHPGKR